MLRSLTLSLSWTLALVREMALLLILALKVFDVTERFDILVNKVGIHLRLLTVVVTWRLSTIK